MNTSAVNNTGLGKEKGHKKAKKSPLISKKRDTSHSPPVKEGRKEKKEKAVGRNIEAP